MKELQRKQKIKRAIYSLPALFILLVSAFFLVRGAAGMMEKEMESSRYVKDLEAKAAALTLRSQELEAKMARLDTEEGKMEEIKEKFNVALEGEHLAILVDEPEEEGSSDNLEEGRFEKLLNFLSGLWR